MITLLRHSKTLVTVVVFCAFILASKCTFGQAKLEIAKKKLQSEKLDDLLDGALLAKALGPKAESTVDDLIKLLGHRSSNVRAAAAEAMMAIGPASKKGLPTIIKEMKGKRVTTQGIKVWVTYSKLLTSFGPEIIPTLIESLDEGDTTTYNGLTASLSEFGEASLPALDKLIENAKSKDEDKVFASIYTIQHIGPKAKKAVPVLVKALDNRDINVQIWACQALAIMGDTSKSTVGRLQEMLKNGVTSARGHAAMALGNLQVSDEKTLEMLVKALDDPNQVVRERAMIGLGHLGPKAKPQLAAIQKSARASSFFNKPVAAKTLWLVTGNAEESVEMLVGLVDKLQYEIDSIRFLGEIGPEAASAVPKILKKMNAFDESIWIEGAIALGNIGPKAKAGLPKLKTLLKMGDAEVKKVVEEAIAKIEKS